MDHVLRIHRRGTKASQTPSNGSRQRTRYGKNVRELPKLANTKH